MIAFVLNWTYVIGGVLLILILGVGGSYLMAKLQNPEMDEPEDDYEDIDGPNFYIEPTSEDIEEDTEVSPAPAPITEIENDVMQDPTNLNKYVYPNGDPSKVAILFGINKCSPRVYQGDSLTLRGCVNDSVNVKRILMAKGFGTIYHFTDASATIGNFLKTFQEVKSTLKDGDTLILQMSRHGMSLGENVLDKKDDREIEALNPDGNKYSGDQGAVMHDGVIVDDCFWRLFTSLPAVKLVYLNDSCHSATQYKVLNSLKLGLAYRKYRSVSKDYLPKKDQVVDLEQLDKLIPAVPDNKLKCTLVSVAGCQDHEYSADAHIGGKYQGAMTAYLVELLKKNPNATPAELKTQLPVRLKAGGYDQNPQINIEGNLDLWNQPLI